MRIPEDERVDFYLYVDEFQNFATIRLQTSCPKRVSII